MAFLRLVFTVYWDGAEPSTEPLYLQSALPAHLTSAEISSAEDQCLAMMKAHAGMDCVPLRAIFIAAYPIDLSVTEVSALGWRLMASQTV